MTKCPYCGRELQGVVLTFPRAQPCCGRGDCLLRAMTEDAEASKREKAGNDR